MTPSLIMRTMERPVVPLLLLISLWLLTRGHNEPGGGFVGGLVAVTAYALRVFTRGPAWVSARLWLRSEVICLSGILAAAASGCIGLARGASFLESYFIEFTLPLDTKFAFNTVLLFDAGVYLVVLGVGLSVLLWFTHTAQE